MATEFKCPHCVNLLNVGDNVVFSTRNSWGKQGLIMLVRRTSISIKKIQRKKIARRALTLKSLKKTLLYRSSVLRKLF